MYELNTKFIAEPTRGNELFEYLSQASASMESLEGCNYYKVMQDENNPDLIQVDESWTSEEQHKASLQNDEVINLIGQAKQIIRDIERL